MLHFFSSPPSAKFPCSKSHLGLDFLFAGFFSASLPDFLSNAMRTNRKTFVIRKIFLKFQQKLLMVWSATHEFIFLKLQLMLYFHSVMIIYAFSSNKFRRWRRELPPLLAYLTARLEIAVFCLLLLTVSNVEICWKRRKIGHYRAVQFSEREAVSISPKQSAMGSTPTGLNPQTSNSFWLMFSRASCQTREEHRLERVFLPSIGNLLFAQLLVMLATF